jgi:hypothetical protein
MLIPSQSDYDLAAQKLVEARFRPAPWTYAITDPHRIPDDEIGRRVRLDDYSDHRKIDDNSVRFQFPEGYPGHERVVLLRSTYVGLSPPTDPSSMQRFSYHENLYYPDIPLLLESFIRTLLQETCGRWRSTLEVWVVCNLYCQKMLEDTILDSCDDESVRSWFNEAIRRGKGGIDRITVTKRVGKGQRSAT